MRILHLLDHSLPLHSGYAFRTRAILRAQSAKGWAVAGITGARHTADGPAVETIDGLTFYRAPRPKPAFSPLGEWREVGALERGIEALIGIFRPDVLHAHSPVLTALAGLRVARRHGLPLVYEIRAFWEDAAAANGTGHSSGLRYRLIREVETYAVANADAIAVICNGLKSDLVRRGTPPDKILVSPNGVDLDLFGAPCPRDVKLARELGLGNAPVIGFIGSYYDYEGVDDLIAAMPALIAGQPELQLLLVGGGPMEARLRAQAAASPTAGQIHFAGRVPHEQVERYYSLVDILVYPRKRMRLTDLVTPLKPLEAMAQKKLVAASDVGGHRELIEDGVTGTLFAPGSPAALANAVLGLFAAPECWDARRAAGRSDVERERNWSSNVSRYAPLYHKLTGKPV